MPRAGRGGGSPRRRCAGCGSGRTGPGSRAGSRRRRSVPRRACPAACWRWRRARRRLRRAGRAGWRPGRCRRGRPTRTRRCTAGGGRRGCARSAGSRGRPRGWSAPRRCRTPCAPAPPGWRATGRPAGGSCRRRNRRRGRRRGGRGAFGPCSAEAEEAAPAGGGGARAQSGRELLQDPYGLALAGLVRVRDVRAEADRVEAGRGHHLGDQALRGDVGLAGAQGERGGGRPGYRGGPGRRNRRRGRRTTRWSMVGPARRGRLRCGVGGAGGVPVSVGVVGAGTAVSARWPGHGAVSVWGGPGGAASTRVGPERWAGVPGPGGAVGWSGVCGPVVSWGVPPVRAGRGRGEWRGPALAGAAAPARARPPPGGTRPAVTGSAPRAPAPRERAVPERPRGSVTRRVEHCTACDACSPSL